MLHAPKTPRWLTPELLVLVGFVATSECLAAALLGATGFGADPARAGRAAAFGFVATAIASALLGRLALREAPSRSADVHALLGASGVGAGLWSLVFALGGEGALAGLAFGATIGLLPSVSAGIVLALLGRTLRSVRMFAGHDALERVGLVAGGAAGLAGAIAIGFVAPRHVAIPLASACVGLFLLAATWRRDVQRCAWLRDVYAGKAPGYAVVPLDEAHIHATEALAPLVPGSSVDAVLLEDPSQGPGPYRATHRPRPIALLQRDAGPSVWPIRARAQRAGLFFAMTVAMAAAASFAQLHRARAATERATVLAAPPARMSCYEARAVFEYRAKETDLAARALFLTHAEDAQIPVGEGWLYLATPRGELPTAAAIAEVLAAETQLPCADMPRIRVMSPVRRPFKVEARLTVEKGESPAAVAAWVRSALAEAFTPGGTSAHESVQFGFYDRKLRWRVVSTIAQTAGVRSSEILLDGKREDIALAPGELAWPEEIALVDAASGKPL